MDAMQFKEGDTHKVQIGADVYKIHIVRVIDEGLTHSPQVVYRYYGKHKQWWHYKVESAYMLTGHINLTKQQS